MQSNFPYVPAYGMPQQQQQHQFISPYLVATPTERARYSPVAESASESSHHDKSGCLCCRIRRKGCDRNPDEYGVCETCRSLNIECLMGYGDEYPEGLKNKDMKKQCLAAIRDWTRKATNRDRTKPALQLSQFIWLPGQAPVLADGYRCSSPPTMSPLIPQYPGIIDDSLYAVESFVGNLPGYSNAPYRRMGAQGY